MRKLSIGIVIGLLAGLLITASLSWAGSPIRLFVNGQEIHPDVPLQVIDGRVMVPARFVAEPLGAAVEWDAAANAVVITSRAVEEQTSEPEQPAEPTETEVPLKSLDLGASLRVDGLAVTVNKIDYTDAGFNVHFSVINNSDKPLESPGRLSFKLTESLYEDEVNRLGYGVRFDKTGYIYPGESRSGYYAYLYDRPIQIESVTYALTQSGIAGAPLATWKVR